MTAASLWASVTSNYEDNGLVTLTNPRDPAATLVDDDYGLSAAQEVIDLFPMYAQVEFDEDDSRHITVGRQGVIAVLFRRGGTSSTIAEVKWKEVFGDEGLLVKLKRTTARARQGPSSNSGVKQKSELSSTGGKVRGWSDVASLPGGRGYMPRQTYAED